MIVVVMGMSKSGTTLVAKTLHESGIDMSPAKTGNYNQSKYEDPVIIKILLQMFNIDRLKSLYIPNKITFNDEIKKQVKDYFAKKKGNWGFKQPWITLCYPEFRFFLPKNHITIGIRRSYKGLLSHWTKRNRKINEQKLKFVQDYYDKCMKLYGIPVLSFENFIKNGPVELEKILNMKLKDVRC